MPAKGGLIMSRQYRLATEADADELLSLTLRAYEPIRKLGINFAAATADKELVLTNIQKNACYVLEEDGRILATISLRMPWGRIPGRTVSLIFGGSPSILKPEKKGRARTCWSGWRIQCSAIH